jgi:DNA modification methylase
VVVLSKGSAMEIDTRIMLGDCYEKLKEIGDNSIDLIFTSPPYADLHTTYTKRKLLLIRSL